MEVGNLKTLTELDISDNKLVGEIPNSLGDCTGLTSPRMGGNFFRGSIPQSIASLGALKACYRLKESLRMLPRLLLLGTMSFVGDCQHFTSPSASPNAPREEKIHILVSSACATFVILGIALVMVYLYLRWLKKKVKEPISTSMDDPCPDISYRALLKATDDFSSMNLIGVGNFGSVYKGILKENVTTVAVKVLHLVHRGALKSFLAECEALKNVRHRNLLKILTVCSSIDHQQNDFKALVYEYMENGSLERWLHPNPTPSHGNEPTRTLNFFQRINIAIDVASALDYLHHQCHIPIIHCDLKPSNILLDAEMVAHVGDFGLAKFLPGSSSDTVANRTSSVGIRGTIGYAPPEYTMGCKVSREGDVYDYGIFLLEMFTGLSPTNDTFGDNLTLHSFVAEALHERVLKITDRILLQERENHSSPNDPQHWLSASDGIFQECLVTLYNIGVICSDEVPGRRMSISGAANQLQKIGEKLFARG
ncbi:receptor kinase-like protein Xa21 [Rhodamnia argentea]|uniref:Receptor kinase-like protein Xa21 n=1 Tax=Rhodamnia argentea TaxID=178133 RepID=A0ABM3HVV5_9MYRT|nr:receptor kinase-like protein Xa21 [Rhodamnia argentea]